MDRQAWIAVIASIIGLVAWQYYVASKYPPLPAANHPAVAQATPGTIPGPAPLVTSGQPEIVANEQVQPPAGTAAPAMAEEIQTLRTPQIKFNFTNLGGGIADAVPQGRQHLAENKQQIRLGQAKLSPIGAVSAKADEDTQLPYTLHQEGDTMFAERTEPDGLKITKEYSLDYQGDTQQFPAVRLKVTFTNTGAQPYKNDGYFVHAGAAVPIHRKDLPSYTSFDWLTDGKYHTDHVTSFDAGHVPLVGIQTHAAKNVIETPLTKAAWMAVKNQFYATVLTPLDAPGPDQEPAAREVWAKRIDLPLSPEDAAQNLPVLHGIDSALGLPGLNLPPGGTLVRNFQIYMGPKYFSRLEKLGHNEQEVMDYGKFKVVSITLLALLNIFHRLPGQLRAGDHSADDPRQGGAFPAAKQGQ